MKHAQTHTHLFLSEQWKMCPSSIFWQTVFILLISRGLQIDIISLKTFSKYGPSKPVLLFAAVALYEMMVGLITVTISSRYEMDIKALS